MMMGAINYAWKQFVVLDHKYRHNLNLERIIMADNIFYTVHTYSFNVHLKLISNIQIGYLACFVNLLLLSKLLNGRT